MATRIKLSYLIKTPQTTVTELTFNTSGTAVMNEKKIFLGVESPNSTPITLTSSNPAVAKLTLENSYWSVEYLKMGQATITATQGSATNAVTVTVSMGSATSTGTTYNVGIPNQELVIDGTVMGLVAGDKVVIAPGSYNGISIQNIVNQDNNNPITICNGNGLVYCDNNNTWAFDKIRNVLIDGSRADGIKYGFGCYNNGYQATTWNNKIDYVTLTNFEMRNVDNSSFGWSHYQDGKRMYDGTEDSYYKGNKFINIKLDNTGAFGSVGQIDLTDPAVQITDLCVDYVFENWEITNCSPAAIIYMGCAQNTLFKGIHVDNHNSIDTTHNGTMFNCGTADVINCSVRNSEGNMARLWPWTLIDGNIHGRTTPRKMLIYGNIDFRTRKYGFCEGQSFARTMKAGLTTHVDIDIFNNTVGDLNKMLDFTGTLYDNYDLLGGTARLFNNVGINLNAGSSNYIWTSYGADLTKLTNPTSNLQSYNNVSYGTYNDADVNPGSLAPKSTSPIQTAPVFSDPVLSNFTEDLYGNPSKGWIGAVQITDINIGQQVPPTKPSIDGWAGNFAQGDGKNFQMYINKSFSAVGLDNYQMSRNDFMKDLVTANPRDGRETAFVDYNLDDNTTYQWKYRGRDWTGQLGPWSDRVVQRMVGVALGSETPLTITKTSGGTLNQTTGNTYTASGSTVYASLGVSLGPNESARLLFDFHETPGSEYHLPYIGWSDTPNITDLSQIKAGLTSKNTIPDQYYGMELITDGSLRSGDNPQTGDIQCLYIHYDGYTWYEVLRGSEGWRDVSNSVNKTGSQISSIAPTTITKYLVMIMPVGTQIVNPRIAYYPAIPDSAVNDTGTGEVSVNVIGIPQPYQIKINGETWVNNKKTFTNGSIITIAPQFDGYSFDPNQYSSYTINGDATLTFTATANP